MADLVDFRICFKTWKSRDMAFCSFCRVSLVGVLSKDVLPVFVCSFFCVKSLTFLQSLDERYIVSHYANIW